MPLKKTSTKNVSSEKNVKSTAASVKVSKSSTGSVTTMKMTVTSAPTMTRLHPRKGLRLSGKRPGAHHHHHSAHRPGHGMGLSTGKGRPVVRQTNLDQNQCDNSDDSGLGFENHMDVRPLHYNERNIWAENIPDLKRRKIELKVENEETNDGYCFPETLKNCKENNAIIRSIPCSAIQNLSRNVTQNNGASKNINRCLPLVSRRAPVNGPITLTTQLGTTSRSGKIQLQIISQPEQQHRARYQTEGSRGAVKDRDGNGFPIVKLIGYDKPTTLQIFIGTDLGRVAPHMFYQACRVSGKNSTPCVEKKIDGTIVIEVELEPSKDMIATCDCVGILKERNVDVEHRFPEQLSPRSKKKSTKCRMVFRTTITNDDGTAETLQVCSQPIVCTQPPGVPEICKKSLTSCPATGGLELFILGKNFLKDTRVVFQQQNNYDSPAERSDIIWEETVIPDKEYLQQTHLVCVVPPYIHQDIPEPVPIRLFVISSGRNSEAHTFMYTPNGTTAQGTAAVCTPANITPSQNGVGSNVSITVTNNPVTQNAVPFLSKMLWHTGTPKQEMDLGMMPPPSSLVPLAQRRPSTNLTVDNNSPPMRPMLDSNSPPMRSLKTELIDENSQGSVHMEHMISENSMDMRQRFRTISESAMDVHHDETTNMTMINENSIDMLQQQQEMIKKHIEAMNENSNSVHSFHEKSNHSMHEESMDTSRSETRIFAANNLLTHTMIETPTLSTNDLKGIDLRMKSSTLAATTLNDLANTQSPSLATLHRFVVTESTNMPLPTQTGQSVENFLTTLENNNGNKQVGSVTTLANTTMKPDNDNMMLQTIKTNSLLDGTPILSSQFAGSATTSINHQLMPSAETGTKLFSNEQVINNTQVLTETLLANNTMNESHIKPNNFEQHLNNQISSQNLLTTGVTGPVIFNQTSTNPIMETTQNNEVITQQNLQAALTTLQNTPKLDALVNSTVESHIGSPIKSPKQELLSSPQDIRRSPLLVTQTPEILINHTTNSPDVILNSQAPLLSSVSAISPNDIIMHSPQNDIAHVSTNLSPDVILNPQVSPSVMCGPQTTMLQGICPPNPIQPEILNENTAQLPPVSVESIVINAAVDYLETQKKINEITRMDSRHLTTAEQQKSQDNLINTLLDVRTNQQQEVILANNQAAAMLQNRVSDILKLSQSQFVTNTSPQIMSTMNANEKPALRNPEYMTQVTMDIQVPKQQQQPSAQQQPQQQQQQQTQETNVPKQLSDPVVNTVPTAAPTELKKNEEGMIPPALTNMSENDLISYINPSCFDQV